MEKAGFILRKKDNTSVNKKNVYRSSSLIKARDQSPKKTISNIHKNLLTKKVD